jgi:acyl-coenzyme A thioesterase PaaI-like protein
MEHVNPAERFFTSQHLVNAFLKIRYRGIEGNTLTVDLIGAPEFVIDAESGTLHTGFATLALDTVMGGAVIGTMEKIQPIATAGLTAQHMRRPRSGERLVCRATCEGFHGDVAHITGVLASAETGETLATAAGTFMIGTRAKPLGTRL